MADRISSDNASLTTVRATLVRSGALDRPKVELPAEHAESFPTDDVVRVVADDTEYRATVEAPLTGDGREIRGLYDTPRLARNPGEGENRLAEWLEGTNLDFGQSVLVDVVEAGFKYGLREPGQRAVYEATEAPDSSLADIAKDIDG
ncbi:MULTISPECIES: DUF7112 family protein [Halorussus]|uniref:DUF7112 family protein n=1 Tax=Halorussus TaxID=1070314 RepID=UPI0020A06833|nr:hypothetical protein [Halorussus vallis]USZ74525.1 hypothetical protein NGM07_13860 [Halorussus vallis]